MKTAKWTVLFALALVMALTLAACGGAASSVASQASDPASVSVSEPVVEDDSTEDEDVSVAGGGEVDEDMAAMLTPDGATITVSEEGALILTSDKSIDELKAFYTGVLEELDATEISKTDVLGWNYTGTYNGDRSISIVITDLDEDDVFEIAIQY